MTIRIFLCNRETWYHDVEDEIREAKEKLSKGLIHRSSWTCSSVKSIRFGEKAYFRRVGSKPHGFFARGKIVDVYEGYVDYEWDSVVDYERPLDVALLQQMPEFRGVNFDFRASGHRFSEAHEDILEEFWEGYLLKLSKQGSSITNYDVYYQRGRDKAKKGLHQQAIEYYSRAIAINPSSSKAYVERGEAYYKINEYKKSIEDYTQVIGIESSHKAAAYYRRGIIQANLGKNREALADFQIASRLFLEKGDLDNYQKSQDKLRKANAEDSEIIVTKKQLDTEEYFAPKDENEARKRIIASIAQRQGQYKFRQSLLEAYNYRCCLTRCDAQEALEAAHIIPYRDTGSNHPSNGLLLRADIHVLFDLNLITIDPNTTQVHLAPTIKDSQYSELEGGALQLPINTAYSPRIESLKWHCSQCSWYPMVN